MEYAAETENGRCLKLTELRGGAAAESLEPVIEVERRKEEEAIDLE